MEKENNSKNVLDILLSEDFYKIQHHLGIKHYNNVDDFLKDYITAINNRNENQLFNTTAHADELFTKSEKDFEKNGIRYFAGNGSVIKEIKQKEDFVRITLSTLGGFSLKSSLDTNGKPDFSLIFSLKENAKINIEKGDVINFIGYTDNKLVLILKGNPIKVNSLDVNEIHAVKLHKKIKDVNLDNTIKITKLKL